VDEQSAMPIGLIVFVNSMLLGTHILHRGGTPVP
jgi:hypothetical protein